MVKTTGGNLIQKSQKKRGGRFGRYLNTRRKEDFHTYIICDKKEGGSFEDINTECSLLKPQNQGGGLYKIREKKRRGGSLIQN